MRTTDDPAPAPRASRATIRDVAAEAGVSVSAVSKVLRDAYGVSPAMRERVTAAIKKLDYRPRTAARAMRGRSYTIGTLLSELTSPYQSEVAAAIASQTEGTGYQQVLAASGTSGTQPRKALETLLDLQIDGLVVVAPWLEPAVLEKVALRLPVVTVALHGRAQHLDTVVDDEELGARLVVDHLVSLGHRRIAHTSQPNLMTTQGFSLSHTARRAGYEAAMRTHHLEPLVIETWYSEEGGYQAAQTALGMAEPPTAVFAGADVAAMGVLRAVEERGLRVPQDVSVVGYDNISVAAMSRVALSTVDESSALTGQAAARLLLERIEGRTSATTYVVAPRLVLRGTTGPVPA